MIQHTDISRISQHNDAVPAIPDPRHPHYILEDHIALGYVTVLATKDEHQYHRYVFGEQLARSVALGEAFLGLETLRSEVLLVTHELKATRVRNLLPKEGVHLVKDTDLGNIGDAGYLHKLSWAYKHCKLMILGDWDGLRLPLRTWLERNGEIERGEAIPHGGTYREIELGRAERQTLQWLANLAAELEVAIVIGHKLGESDRLKDCKALKSCKDKILLKKEGPGDHWILRAPAGGYAPTRPPLRLTFDDPWFHTEPESEGHRQQRGCIEERGWSIQQHPIDQRILTFLGKLGQGERRTLREILEGCGGGYQSKDKTNYHTRLERKLVPRFVTRHPKGEGGPGITYSLNQSHCDQNATA